MERQSQYRYWPHPSYHFTLLSTWWCYSKQDLQSESILIICRRYKNGAALYSYRYKRPDHARQLMM